MRDLIDADAAAKAAAADAGVVVREIGSLDELDEASVLFAEIWGRDTLGTELMRALGKAGSYLAGAYAGPTLVAAGVAFFTEPAERALHSHIAAVRPGQDRHGVGLALKLHQRSWALERGLVEIHWTFDPLIARNAYFNIAKLAADPEEYLPNFYGPMLDAINLSDDSDRIFLRWRLDAPYVVAAAAGLRREVDADAERAAGAVVALGIGDGRPVRGAAAPGCDTALVAVPPDAEAMRLTDPGLARQWRLAVREAITRLVADGMRVAGFDRAGWYVVRRTEGS